MHMMGCIYQDGYNWINRIISLEFGVLLKCMIAQCINYTKIHIKNAYNEMQRMRWKEWYSYD